MCSKAAKFDNMHNDLGEKVVDSDLGNEDWSADSFCKESKGEPDLGLNKALFLLLGLGEADFIKSFSSNCVELRLLLEEQDLSTGSLASQLPS